MSTPEPVNGTFNSSEGCEIGLLDKGSISRKTKFTVSELIACQKSKAGCGRLTGIGLHSLMYQNVWFPVG